GCATPLVFHDGRVLASSTGVDAISAAVGGATGRALVLGRGGSAKAAIAALADRGLDVTVVSRADPGWPPDADGYAVVVNATPVKDDPLIRPAAGQVLIDLPYNDGGEPTAFALAGRAPACRPLDAFPLLLAPA